MYVLQNKLTFLWVRVQQLHLTPERFVHIIQRVYLWKEDNTFYARAKRERELMRAQIFGHVWPKTVMRLRWLSRANAEFEYTHNFPGMDRSSKRSFLFGLNFINSHWLISALKESVNSRKVSTTFAFIWLRLYLPVPCSEPVKGHSHWTTGSLVASQDLIWNTSFILLGSFM